MILKENVLLATRLSVAGIVLTLLLSVTFLTSCKSQKNSIAELDSVVQEKMGANVFKEFNPSKTYVLYKQSNDSALNENVGQKYVVYRLKNKEVSLEGTYSRGYIKWINDTVLEILHVPSNANPGPDLTVYKRHVLLQDPGLRPDESNKLDSTK